MRLRNELLIFTSLAAATPSRTAEAQTTARVGVDSSAAQTVGGASRSPAMSADGRFVTFESYAPNRVAGDTNATRDVFVRDTLKETTTRVSVDPAGAQFPGDCLQPAASADGRCVSFLHADLPLTFDVYLHDRSTGQTILVSAALGGGPSNGISSTPAVPGDGRFVASSARRRTSSPPTPPPTSTASF